MKYTGFIKPQIDHTHYMLGSSPVPLKVIRENGDWSLYLPEKELQNIKFETYNCTSFNTLNQIEVYMKAVFGETVNYSDRWLGIIAGTKEPGNDPHVVMEAIRKHGLIPESMLPDDPKLASIDEYYSFMGADEAKCRAEGQRWLEKWDFKHEWVFSPDQPQEEKINNMKVALKYSPLALAVYAWAEDAHGVYIRLGDDCHWTMVYSYDDLQRVFDSYEPVLKDMNEAIFYCKRTHIERKKKDTPSTLTFWQKFINWLKHETDLFRYFNGNR